MRVFCRWAAIAVAILASVPMLSAAQTSDVLFRQRMADYGIRFTEGNNVTLLMSGQAKFDDMFKAIRQARHSVHLEYFNFRNDSIASLLFDILREKRREGVEVRALFDGFGNDSNNQPLKKYHLEALRRDSVDIYEFDPIRFPWVNHIWPRDHRKIVVIDGRIAYTGGMNVADYYIKGTEQVGSWRDMHCRIEGPAVNELQHIFCRIWQEVTGEDIIKPQYFKGLPVGDKTIGIVNREPGAVYSTDGYVLGKSDAMRALYVNAIDAAQDSLKLINPYFTLTSSVKKALKRAVRRGVKVEIMVSAKSDVPLTPDCVFRNAYKMKKCGAHVWLYEPGFHHSKILMVDGRFCTVGSANLDARSMRFDYEENAVILSREITKQLDDMFDRDKMDSFYLTRETWNEFRTPWQKFRGWFGSLLRPWL
ncbi:MAG: cardiolipin synthase [Prevotella sp.]|jgi:cardiolipin synthase|nr:cardiolipin synthase [Prevotella sp.]